MHISELWEAEGFGPATARIALTPLSWLYAAGWEAYLAIYRFGLKRANHPHSPILCIGNLISGGSGKTPVTIRVVELLAEHGLKPVVSCSGHGSPRSEAATIAPDGPLDARTWGDEAAQYRWLLPDLPLIVGRRRVLAAQLCHESFPDSVLVLDDGFQHLPLDKDLTIVLDPLEPVNRRCLPAGPYREPRWNRRRADLVLPGDFHVRKEIGKVLDALGRPMDVPEEAFVLCAVGNPKGVLASLELAGAKVTGSLFRPDHDPLTDGNLVSDLPKGIPIVTTLKDWVKLKERQDLGGFDFRVLDYRIEVEPRELFCDWLVTQLHGKEKQSHH